MVCMSLLRAKYHDEFSKLEQCKEYSLLKLIIFAPGGLRFHLASLTFAVTFPHSVMCFKLCVLLNNEVSEHIKFHLLSLVRT